MNEAVLDVVSPFSFESIVVCTLVSLEERSTPKMAMRKNKNGIAVRQRKALIERQQAGGHTGLCLCRFSSHFCFPVPLSISKSLIRIKQSKISFPRFAVKSTTIGI